MLKTPAIAIRPHSALDNMTPEEYVKKHLKSQKSLIYVVQLLGEAQYENLELKGWTSFRGQVRRRSNPIDRRLLESQVSIAFFIIPT